LPPRDPFAGEGARGDRLAAVASEDSDRGFGKDEDGVDVGGDGGGAGEVVGIGVAVGPVVFPLILFAAEGDDGDGAGEGRRRAS
jgi:hypothetical protein